MATFDDDVIHQPCLPGKPCAFTWKKCNTTDAFPADFTAIIFKMKQRRDGERNEVCPCL